MAEDWFKCVAVPVPGHCEKSAWDDDWNSESFGKNYESSEPLASDTQSFVDMLSGLNDNSNDTQNEEECMNGCLYMPSNARDLQAYEDPSVSCQEPAMNGCLYLPSASSSTLPFEPPSSAPLGEQDFILPAPPVFQMMMPPRLASKPRQSVKRPATEQLENVKESESVPRPRAVTKSTSRTGSTTQRKASASRNNRKNSLCSNVARPLATKLRQLWEVTLTPDLMRSVMKGYIHLLSAPERQKMVELAYKVSGKDLGAFVDQQSRLKAMWKEQVNREHGFEVMPATSAREWWRNHKAFVDYYRDHLWNDAEFRMLLFQLDCSFHGVFDHEPTKEVVVPVNVMTDGLAKILDFLESSDTRKALEESKKRNYDQPLEYHTELNAMMLPHLKKLLILYDMAPSAKNLFNVMLQCIVNDDPEVVSLSGKCVMNEDVFY